MNKYPHPIIEEQDIQTIVDILRSGQLSGFVANGTNHMGGKHVQALEDAFCEYFNVKHAIAMNSATACLHTALLACDIHMRDEVIVTPYSFSASASCVLMANAIPVFADIDDQTFNLAPQSIRKGITSRTRCLIPVHLAGHPCDMTQIQQIAKENNLKVIEDAAQAIGAEYQGQKVGTIGDCGVFSFNQSKHISTGEGGMLITNDDNIAEAAREIRNHGEVAVGGRLGYNYRMTEYTAALALPQFKKLDKMTDIRIELANTMSFQLDTFEGIRPPVWHTDCKHVYYTYNMKFDNNCYGIHRDEFQRRMLEKGVYFGAGYVKPIYLQPLYQERKHDLLRYYPRLYPYSRYAPGLCPVAEDMWRNKVMVVDWLRFPMEVEEVYDVMDVIREVLRDVL